LRKQRNKRIVTAVASVVFLLAATTTFFIVTKGFDYLSQPACLTLRAMVHEAFAREAGDYFGDVIVGSFQDELPSMPTWCHDFATSFAAAYGYDIVPKLIALFEGEDPAS
jgi:ribose/xylose/arabinose/galactoside ABC-type transport system permease subunit